MKKYLFFAVLMLSGVALQCSQKPSTLAEAQRLLERQKARIDTQNKFLARLKASTQNAEATMAAREKEFEARYALRSKPLPKKLETNRTGGTSPRRVTAVKEQVATEGLSTRPTTPPRPSTPETSPAPRPQTRRIPVGQATTAAKPSSRAKQYNLTPTPPSAEIPGTGYPLVDPRLKGSMPAKLGSYKILTAAETLT